MAERGPGEWSWIDRVRRWLWLDRTQRTDGSEADRGFYPGGMPVYVNRKPVGWRFLLIMVAIGIAISLVILMLRDAQAQPAPEHGWFPREQAGFPVPVSARYERPS